jgi:hypothetical protein
VTWDSDGSVKVWNLPEDRVAVAAYADKTLNHADLYFDMLNDQWEMWLDGIKVFSGKVHIDEMNKILLNHGTHATIHDPSATTYIDNIRIAVVP